jgi:Protein of unknown function (DUF3180)
LKQLRFRVLIGLFVVAGVLAWAGARLWDAEGTLPSVPLAAPIVLGLIAAVLAATALSLRGRLRAQRERRPEAKGVDPMLAARAVVFGQSSALVAALVAGMYGGVCVFLVSSQLDIAPRRDQAVYSGFAVVAGAAVVAAALFLERVCRLPDDEDKDNPGGPGVTRA